MSIENFSIGCIGCGNMGSAILLGLIKNESLTIMGYDVLAENIAPLQGAGIASAKDIEHLVISSRIILLAVKPHLIKNILPQITPLLTPDKIIISVAAGVSTKTLQEGIQNKCAVIRCMPNTPALVGAGVFAFCFEDEKVAEKDKEYILQIFQNIGMCVELSEDKFTAFSALIGAGPAYAFHLMNSLVQAGVTLGFSRTDSRQMTEQLFKGCVRMAQTSTSNLTKLRDDVCSPGGLTIAGINHLERTAVSGHIIDAVLEANKRGKEMEQ